MDQAKQFYRSRSECISILYDLHCPSATERLYRVRGGLGDSAHVDYLDARYVVLVIRPGGALGACR
jgi:hypothetical protein